MNAVLDEFDIPIALFIFRRQEGAVRIIERLSQVRPKKVYLIADQGRTPEECDQVKQCRKAVEEAITWNCEIVKHYADANRGVFENIGLGAKWVFSQEEKAIFLEDDNLPEKSFFPFCKELLDRYKDDERILWICGTNYFGDSQTEEGESYKFTQALLPCGWASWSWKFLKYYDAEFELYKEQGKNQLKKRYKNRALARQQNSSIETELWRKKHGNKYGSWDYQMVSSIRLNDLCGIVPMKNQIKNIGVDALSEHGGVSFDDEMTRRFCGMDSFPLEFPLVHPAEVVMDDAFEDRLDKVILQPRLHRIKALIKKQLLRLTGSNFGYSPFKSR